MRTKHRHVHVSGHLEDKRGIYQMILNWKDSDGKRCRKSISTRLEVIGNRIRAERMLNDECRNMEKILGAQSIAVTKSELLFSDYLESWLETIASELKPTTFGNYQSMVRRVIGPYFRDSKITLSNLTANDILEFYSFLKKRVKASTIHKYHNVFSKSLSAAVERDFIEYSPMQKVKRPQAERFIGKFLKESEVIELFEAVKGHKLEFGVVMGIFYGMRRSEIIGLKWDSIDFYNNTFIIEHSVTIAQINGHKQSFENDTVKTKSSHRTMPLVPRVRKRLLEIKQEQENNRKLYGNGYSEKDAQYIYVDQFGKRIRPDYLTAEFPKFLEGHGFRKIRFHDLRHSCASLLLSKGVPMKHIQEWLGHSYLAITANTYAHLEWKSKIETAEAMTWLEETTLGAD